MKVRIVHSIYDLKDNEQGMIIPCANSFETFLAVSKETNEHIETDKCPICGKRIYLESSGIMGHC